MVTSRPLPAPLSAPDRSCVARSHPPFEPAVTVLFRPRVQPLPTCRMTVVLTAIIAAAACQSDPSVAASSPTGSSEIPPPTCTANPRPPLATHHPSRPSTISRMHTRENPVDITRQPHALRAGSRLSRDVPSFFGLNRMGLSCTSTPSSAPSQPTNPATPSVMSRVTRGRTP